MLPRLGYVRPGIKVLFCFVFKKNPNLSPTLKGQGKNIVCPRATVFSWKTLGCSKYSLPRIVAIAHLTLNEK